MDLQNILIITLALLVAMLSFPSIACGSSSGIVLASSALTSTTASSAAFNINITSLGCISALDSFKLPICPITVPHIIVETDLPIDPILTESFTTTQNITLQPITSTTTLVITTVTMTISEVDLSTTTALCAAGIGGILTPCTTAISATAPVKKSAAIRHVVNPIGDAITNLKGSLREIGLGFAQHNNKIKLFRRVPNYCIVEAVCLSLGCLYILTALIACCFYWKQILFRQNEWIPNPVTVAIVACGMIGWAFIGYAYTVIDRCYGEHVIPRW